MADRVPSEGSTRAPIILIGEAPGHWEHEYGRPFVGPSYTDRLLPWWRDVGLSREAFFITNVLDVDPLKMGYHGKGLYDPAINSIPEQEVRAAFEALHSRIALHEGPDGGGPIIIVPTGNYALYALTGKGRVSFHQRDGKWPRPGIMAWRGSILEYQDQRGRRIKVIPTVHPAATFPFRQPGLEWVCRADWKRIAEDMKFRELRLPERQHLIMPSAAEAIEWMRWTRGEAEKRKNGEFLERRIACSLDVETPKRIEYATKEGVSASVAPGTKCRMCGHTRRWHDLVGNLGTAVAPVPACRGLRGKGGCAQGCTGFAPPLLKPKRIKTAEYPYLDCIGYAWDPKLSLTIPTTAAYWQDPAMWEYVKAEIAAFHADPNIDFGGQNFSFDAWWCAVENLPLHGMAWDLLKQHRIRVPFSEWHDLAFQASLYTREPYWKDEAKDPDSVQRYVGSREAFYTYNGKDNCVQRELLPLHVAALRAQGRWEFYTELEAPLDPALLELSLTGTRQDEAGRAEHYEKVMAEAREVSAQLNAAAGMPIVGETKKGVIIGKVPSTAKLKVFLYERLRLPAQYTKNSEKKKTVSTNVVTILRLMERFAGIEQLQTVGRFVLRLRRLNVEANFVKESAVAADGRSYGFFKQDTRLGRLSCSKTPKGEGRNQQNIDRKLRRFYLPDREEVA